MKETMPPNWGQVLRLRSSGVRRGTVYPGCSVSECVLEDVMGVAASACRRAVG
jgi:hypothetical protein